MCSVSVQMTFGRAAFPGLGLAEPQQTMMFQIIVCFQLGGNVLGKATSCLNNDPVDGARSTKKQLPRASTSDATARRRSGFLDELGVSGIRCGRWCRDRLTSMSEE